MSAARNSGHKGSQKKSRRTVAHKGDGGKQIRKSLKTTDKKLAKRRLITQREKVSRLNNDKDTRNITLAELSGRWLDIQRTKLKASSTTRCALCIKNLI